MQPCQRATTAEQQDKPEYPQRNQEPGGSRIVPARFEDAPAVKDEYQGEQVTRVTEQVKQDVSDPGADDSPVVMDFGNTDRLRPAGVGGMVGKQRQGDEQRAGHHENETDFLDIPYDLYP